MSQGHSQNVNGWVNIYLKSLMIIASWEWFRGCRICVLWLTISPLFSPLLGHAFHSNQLAKQVTLAAVGISGDELQQGETVKNTVKNLPVMHRRHPALTHLTPEAVTVPGYVCIWISTSPLQQIEDKLEGKRVLLQLFQVHLRVLPWLISTVHSACSSWGLCSCRLSLLGDTPCIKQAAVYTETIARQHLSVLCYSKTAWIPVEAPLEVQHGRRQKQRDMAKSRSGFFFLDEFLCSCYVSEPRLTDAPSVPHVLLI